jgi:hypothetical protein
VNPVSVTGYTPLQVLGLRPGASEEEIRAAYRGLARAVHPDVLPTGGALFAIIQAALEGALEGRGWPPRCAGVEDEPGAPSFPPAPPRPPRKARQRARPKTPKPPQWRQTVKGNFTRKRGDQWITVYPVPAGGNTEGPELWVWIGPDPSNTNVSIKSKGSFRASGDAILDADMFYGGR